MTTTQLDTLTDYLAKTNSTMFPTAEKLLYYNIAKDLLSAEIISQQEDNFETEWTKTTVDGQSEYQEPARIHHINWLKINYGDGFIPARHKPEAELIAEYGDQLEDTLDSWSESDPIYHYKGSHFFVYPAPATGDGAVDRLKGSVELLPVDLGAGDTPTLPVSQHHYLAVYAAWTYHKNNSEEALALLKANDLPLCLVRPDPIKNMLPRARQAEMIAMVPNEDGFDL